MKKVFLVLLAMIFVFSVFCTSISISAATVDKTALSELVTQAADFQSINYDSGAIAWKLFEMKLEEAQAVLADPNATQIEVNDAKKQLQDAIDRLGRQVEATEPIDKSVLETLISQAVAYNKSDFDIDNTLWNDFQAKLANAIMVFNGDKISQQDVDNAKNNLMLAMEIVEQYRKGADGDSTQPSYTQNPNGENNNSTGGVASTEATSVVTAKPTKPATEPEPETRPKSTTPFLQGGFIEIGCDASVAISALAIVGIFGSVLVIKKKRD